MFLFKAAFCRVFQAAFRLVLPVLPYREPEIVCSCEELKGIFQKERIHTPLIVTDQGIVASGLVASLEEALKSSGVSYAVYDKTQPNPTVSNVEEALALYHARDCDSLIAIGGGSSMDCAKAIGARVAQPKMSLQQMKGIQ